MANLAPFRAHVELSFKSNFSIVRWIFLLQRGWLEMVLHRGMKKIDDNFAGEC